MLSSKMLKERRVARLTLPPVARVVAANSDTWDNKRSNDLISRTKEFLRIRSDTLTEKIVSEGTQEAADAVLIRRFASFLNYDQAVFCSAQENRKFGKPDEQAAYDCRPEPGADNTDYFQQQAESFGTVYVVTHDRYLLKSLERLEKHQNTHNKKCVYVFNARYPLAADIKRWTGPSNVHIIGPFALQYVEFLATLAAEVNYTVLADKFSFETPQKSSLLEDEGVLILFDGDPGGAIDVRDHLSIQAINAIINADKATKEAAALLKKQTEFAIKSRAVAVEYADLRAQAEETKKIKAAAAADSDDEPHPAFMDLFAE